MTAFQLPGVYGDGFVVLVESKVNGDFWPGQMQAHFEYLKHEGYSEPTLFRRTWRDLHSAFVRLLPRLDGIPKFLVEQFIQFLEYSGMGGFTGFQIEHFRYFLLHDDDDSRRWIREQVTSLGDLVLASLKAEEPFYNSLAVGNLKSDQSECWVAFGPPD
jgi:hypothetical protein